MPCFSVSMGASLPRTFHLTFGAAILPHGRISKTRLRHEMRNDAGYNYMRVVNGYQSVLCGFCAVIWGVSSPARAP